MNEKQQIVLLKFLLKQWHDNHTMHGDEENRDAFFATKAILKLDEANDDRPL